MGSDRQLVGNNEARQVEIDFGDGQSMRLSRDDDGGLRIEQVVTRIDGRRDHLKFATRVNRVDAERVFALLGAER